MPVNVMAVDAPTALVTQKSCPAAVGKGTAIVQVVVQIPYACGSVTLNAPRGVGRGVAGRSAATTVRIPPGAAEPEAGPAKNVFAVRLADVSKALVTCAAV